MTPPLVFILGNHRSGTTWLYQLMAGTGAFTPLTAHDVIARREPGLSVEALAERMRALGIAERKLDGVPISPGLPEEYCYVLNNAGFASWTTRRSLPLLRALVEELGRAGKPVLLKNPWDYANFELLAREFPEARFVFLHRHPLRVVQSALAVFREMMADFDPYLEMLSARYHRLREHPLRRGFLRWFSGGVLATELFIGGVRASNDWYLRRVGRLGPRALSLRYEDLCADPAAELGRVFAGLGLDAAAAPAVPPRPGPAGLWPELARRSGRVAWQMGAYLRAMRYEATP